MVYARLSITFLLMAGVPALVAQTTQGLISGFVVDSLTGEPVPGARVTAFNNATNLSQPAVADASGSYALPLLSPGTYQVRAEAKDYQALEVAQLELRVATVITLPFRLRKLSNVFEQKNYRSVFLADSSVLPFYGPDVDTSRTASFEPTLGMHSMLETSVSFVIDPRQIDQLPLSGRDVYALLVTLPGVTTDTSTGRGLGLSVNGQRPSSSNFLLDGLENNNYLITGPAITVAPEALQEYRISTSNYSAEYGRTSGFLANAVTRTGGNKWHGLAYVNFQNEALGANQFQRNRTGLSRPSDKDWEPGVSAGGPLPAPHLFASVSLEKQRFRGAGDPEDIKLPTRNFVPPAGSLAQELLKGFDAPEGPGLTATVRLTPPFSIDRWSLIPRADYSLRQGSNRLLWRAAVVRNTRPDFIWTPYSLFSSPLRQNTTNIMAGWLGSRGRFTNEARANWMLDELSFDRAQPSVPVLASSDAVLPGSPASYGFHNRARSVEFVEALVWTLDRHTLKAGGGGLFRRIEGALTAGRDGYYDFASLQDFANNRVNTIRIALDRNDFKRGIYRPSDYERRYREREAHFFVQDSFRVSSRIVLNGGVRYEKIGPPVNAGAIKDPTITFESGVPLSLEVVRAAQLQPGRPGDQQLYQSDGNWAIRAGASWSLRADARTLLRASYGVFYDRPFDNLWLNLRNNGTVISTARYNGPVVMPVANLLPSLQGLNEATDFTKLYAFSPVLKAPRIQSYFLGLSHEVTRSFVVEADAFNANGSDLITTDLINRTGGPVNPDFPAILYRANQGASNYHGLGVSARYRTARSQLHVAYTWSHSIDNQSEPLFGDFYDLLPTRPGAGPAAPYPATFFFQQYNSAGDRGNSDFDQRHNLVALGIWNLPQPPARWSSAAWLRDWRVSMLAAVRSSFPYTVTSNSLTQRLSLTNPAGLAAPRTPVDGGVQWFGPDAFVRPPGSAQGNTSRNQFAGPGLYSVDASLSRSWPVGVLGKSARVSLRVDAYNVLNHANLGPPGSALNKDNFGVALYGRMERKPTFPALTPFNESARRIQLLLRFEF